MVWEKKGLIYRPPEDESWKHNSALTPTAFLKDDDTIRVYASFRDLNGIGRIGFVDVDSHNPLCIKHASSEPVLDLGKRGMFDDNGVILGDIIRVDNQVYMYYVGFQLVENVKFLAYTGLAISDDNGDTFNRYQETPILDRYNEAQYINAIHSVIYENNVFRCWHAVGNGWEVIDGVEYPQYDINYIESRNGIDFSSVSTKSIKNNKGNGEYRIGRPRVYKLDSVYVMNFTYGTVDGRYKAGQATSADGVNWTRNDQKLGIELSDTGWDSVHLSYPSVIQVRDKVFMFYNGNNMGKDGFGYAELVKG